MPRSRLSRLLWSLLSCLVASAAAAAPTTEPAPIPPPEPVVWETALPDFGDAAYHDAVERLFADFEARHGADSLRPGARGSVGLKIYTDSGPGLNTPPALVRAVIAALERRGFETKKIFLVGLNQMRLRESGFLPALSKGGNSYADHPVFVLESGKFYDTQWFYDSPLPARFAPGVLEQKSAPEDEQGGSVAADRKSFLATPLFLEADFWINLPVYSDHPVLGINGALVNATLWNASNTQRFFRSPANAPAAVAEMAAIPELRETWKFTLVSLQCYQYIGGPLFHSLYTVSEPRLWLSADPVLLDALMLERINAARKHDRFVPIMGDDRRLLEYCERLGVGSASPASVQWRRP
ncbi:MAG TPA: DUF362 domain-containing protein [Opitutaceae bacterium]|nr:DUF362 domain-containing protein [Opitutaceae bacterium]